jgi:hypothetical protein
MIACDGRSKDDRSRVAGGAQPLTIAVASPVSGNDDSSLPFISVAGRRLEGWDTNAAGPDMLRPRNRMLAIKFTYWLSR